MSKEWIERDASRGECVYWRESLFIFGGARGRKNVEANEIDRL